MQRKDYRAVIEVLNATIVELKRQLEEAKKLNHDLSLKLTEANLSLSATRKVRDDVIASPGSQYGETK